MLVIEDNQDLAATLKSLFTLVGYQAETAWDGLSGLEAARRMKPDVILIDIGLPLMNGYDVANVLLRDASTAHARLIAMSAYPPQAFPDRERNAHFFARVTKPVSFNDLIEIIESPEMQGACSPGGETDDSEGGGAG